jgi:hypothetical protein
MKAERAQRLAKMDDEQFRRHTIAILERELGEDGVARFLRVAQTGSGDYTRDRHKWLDGVTLEQIMEDIARLEQRSS